MPSLDEISYSRDKCVAAVRNYYIFLTKLYLNESEIIEPPESGWPSVTMENFEGLNKTEIVIDLLRHLPYIRDNNGAIRAQGAADCYFADWREDALLIPGPWGDDGESLRISSEGASIYEVVPSSVVGLTSGSRDNPRFLLDTELGVVYWYECPGEIRFESTREQISDDPYDYAEEAQAEWRAEGGAWAITDFFETLKDQFRELNFIPTGPWSVVDVFTHGLPDGMVEMLQSIYRENGWPDLEQYKKDDFLAAVFAALKQNYPGMIDCE